MVLTLRHKDILPPGSAVHLTRATVSSVRPKAFHTHDYTEIFWVQNGHVRHHTPDGMTVLREGDVVIVPTGSQHALQGKGPDAMIVMLCFAPAVTKALTKRHAATATILNPDSATIHHRDTRELAQLNQSALRLERSARDPLAADSFLLPLCADLQRPVVNGPDWLQRACLAAHDPATFQQGAAGFVAQAGQSHPHVSRTMKQYTGQTPVQYINDIRMKHAANALTGSNDPLSEIAADVGIPNLSHFHKLFRAHHGHTPAQYRAAYQRDVAQPQ